MIIKYPDYSRKYASCMALEVRVNNLRKGTLQPGHSIEIQFPEKSQVTIKLGFIASIKLVNPDKQIYTIAKTWWLCNFNWINNLFLIISLLSINLVSFNTPAFYAVITILIVGYITITRLVSKKALRLTIE